VGSDEGRGLKFDVLELEVCYGLEQSEKKITLDFANGEEEERKEACLNIHTYDPSSRSVPIEQDLFQPQSCP
jgi:hypothetical protein